ncbi:unnamed protein product [Colletotrichum noveboracense]|uniref:Uncharacterized protein n=1 Tax=Colletotrichum noveboracense TaxID=2664923 RepID=A0A9W4RQ46_9PEZI|nr:hypothetical protein K456DRAFT_1720574 [Colletotrichum gloeosporioides 23]CAI0645380.1 unnamed protein product [Colletotrichum noveboracense]
MRLHIEGVGKDEGYTYKECAASFATLLVRKDEVVTVMLQGPKRPGGDDPASGHAVLSIAVRSAGKDEPSPQALPKQAVRQMLQPDVEGIPDDVSVAHYYITNMANITPGTHVGNVIDILRNMRTARTFQHYAQGLAAFRRYVAISCCEKMEAGTYRRGENKRNFFTAITSATIAECKEYCQWDEGGAQPFSAEQLKIMQVVVAFLRSQGKGPGLEVYPYERNPWYDLDGRKAFHAVLSRLVKGNCHAIRGLVKRRSDRERWNNDRTYFDDSADQLVAWAYHLSLFHHMFEHRIYQHLHLLARVYKLSSALCVESESPLYHEYYKKAPISDTADRRGKHRYYSDTNPEREMLRHLDTVSEWDWADAGKQYIKNLSLHVRAMMDFVPMDTDLKARPGQEIVSEIVWKTHFRFFEGTIDGGDREMLPISELLGTLKTPEGRTRSTKTQQRIMSWINSQRTAVREGSEYDFDATHHDGTVHHEATMLGIQLLPQMKRPLKLVVTTEQCCPTCAYLFEFCKNNADRGFLGAEVSPDWSACSLPSWIPKKAGRHVMERAEDVLQHRLEMMVARYKEAEIKDLRP